jgi:ATP-dependent RNA helicase SUPV3L1/SUV3
MSLVPVSSKVMSLQHAWEQWALALSRGKASHLKVNDQPMRQMNLQDVEDLCRLYSAYAWLGYRLPECFPDVEAALELSRQASDKVDSILRDQNAAERKRQPKKYR